MGKKPDFGNRKREDRPVVLPAPPTLLTICLAVLVLAGPLDAAEPRRVISLDGRWEIDESNLSQPPAVYTHDAPVPGLADMAEPAFENVGLTNHWREAFWYRRSIQFAGPVPASAVIKVHKAAYGARVFLNGAMIGDHSSSFTPGYFDVRAQLRGNNAKNELLIRVGATREAVPRNFPTGFDFEKVRYIPGLFDTVELILTGTPHIERVQCAPDPGGQSVKVQAVLTNAGPEMTDVVAFTVREAKSGRIVGRAKTGALEFAAGESKTVSLAIPIARGRPWSPEEPFLYDLEAGTRGDAVRARFGLREFHLDPQTGRAYLNGKPYFLRGSNVTLYRFFEDALRGNLPWDRDWVRRLHRQFRSMHWNALRYCIGFPPEFWYDIADEEGFLIQDEYPLWSLDARAGAPTQADLAREYTEWLQERWNHPCVVIWDAQNETQTKETGAAIQQVRGLDLSNRPWDNGWAPAQARGDVYESHPYLFSNPDFRLRDMPGVAPVPGGNPVPNSQTNAIILNEYGWLWLNRDGTPTTLTRGVYTNLLGGEATPAERRRLYARSLAALTEFWRTHRACAGVLHFCGLGYSRTNGQTCDNFIDVRTLAFEPAFESYVRDAFAPVGLMLDVWAEDLPGGQTNAFPMVAINDLGENWKGTARLRLSRGGAKLREAQVALEIPGFGRQELALSCAVPKEPGHYELEAALLGHRGDGVRSRREFDVLTPERRQARHGLALGKPATASSFATVAGVAYPPEYAVDGILNTRWSSEFSDPQWLIVDLLEVQTIARVDLLWEPAYAKGYRIEVSPDALTWTSVYTTEDGKGGKETIRFKPVATRYVRLYGTRRGTPYGYSLWELRVFH